MQKLKRMGWLGLVAVCLVGLVSPTELWSWNPARELDGGGGLPVQTGPGSGAMEPAAKTGRPVAGTGAGTARPAGVKAAATRPAAAEGVEHVTLGDAMAPLYGPWRFSVGDSPIDPVTRQPLWAQPGFDDSHWETVSLKPKDGTYDPLLGTSGYVPGWTAMGHPGYSGYAWYRLKVAVRGSQRLDLEGPDNFDDGLQVFADGWPVGSFGDLSKVHPRVYSSQPTLFTLPDVVEASASESSGHSTEVTRTIAFRVWMEPSTLYAGADAGGLHGPPLLGQAGAIAADHQNRWTRLIRAQAFFLIDIPLFLLLAVVALSLSLFDRSDKVYFWIAGTYLLLMTFTILQSLTSLSETIDLMWYSLLEDGLLVTTSLAAWVMVWWVWFKLKRPRWLPVAVAVLTVFYSVGTVVGNETFFGLVPHAVAPWFHLLSEVARLSLLGLLVLIVVLGVRQQGREGWVALPAVLLFGVSRFQNELRLLHIPVIFFPFGASLSLGTAAQLALTIAIFVLLVRRGLISVRVQREQALDIQQAVEVQTVILPEARAAYFELTIESEYRAARQVGGDFFQVIPNEADGSLLVVAGDVAGKGLQAGMLVALLVGAVRMAAEVSSDPLYVLEALNRRLLGRKSAQATCLALSIRKDGEVTLANAGHIPPYLNGKPVAMEGALPLGMMAGAEFSVMRFRLEPGDKLLVISDGILEAMNRDGELFGFERVRAMLEGGAGPKALADAAEAFGQEDDISLVAVSRA